MTPYQQAETYFGSNLRDVETWHCLNGVCVCTPEVFLLARPVWSWWVDSQLEDVKQCAPEGDCWYIWWLSGSMEHALPLLSMAQGKEFISYHRRGKLRLRTIAVLDAT